MSDRAYKNPFHDFTGQKIDWHSWQSQIKLKIDELLHTLEREYQPDWHDFSVYTGSAGLAFMYFYLYKKFPMDPSNKDYLSKSATYVDAAIKYMRGNEVTFLCGIAGPLALGAVIMDALGDQERSQKCLDDLLSLQQTALQRHSIPDEFLYGRVGYLFSLHFVRKHLQINIDQRIFNELVEKIVESGKKLSRNQKSPSPLMYQWYNTLYLGAAHGITGIVYMIIMNDILFSQKNKNQIILEQTINYLKSLRFSSGNYPAAVGENDDILVHWCHGAPGWVYMYLAAYKSFQREDYLKLAENCGEVVWKRGLLKKGYGICHGVAGNGYVFLALYKETKNPKHLFRALKFGEFIFDYGKHGSRIADNPYSLFEGMAGTICYLIDLLSPTEAKFPAFEL